MLTTHTTDGDVEMKIANEIKITLAEAFDAFGEERLVDSLRSFQKAHHLALEMGDNELVNKTSVYIKHAKKLTQ